MKKLSIAILASLYGFHAQAAEVRSMGMGSVTAVGGSYLSAPTNNPALLASQIDDTDDFGMILPGISVEAEDSDDLANGIDEFQDAYDRLEELLEDAEANPLFANQDELDAARENLIDKFANLDSELLVGVDAGLVIAGHTRIGSLALFADTQIDAIVIADIDEAHDSEVIREADTTEELEDNLRSSAQVIAANVLELGVTYADNYEYQGHQFSLGLTLKNQRVDFFNYETTISDFDEDDFDGDEYLNDDSNFNIDLGAVYKVNQNWTLGLSARNLISNDYTSKPSDITDEVSTYKIGPEITVGAAYYNGYLTVAADLELTGTERFEGSEDDSQYASIGVEGDLFKWAQLRLGYKHDIEGNYDGKYTFGLGLAPFGVFHIDLAAQYAEDRKGALGLQLSYTF
ncbi:conjugal transfer protein TraF [Catenovulum sp. 2E275]|uniref:conjugal transfer protein TraF n=1 Tax=Catenovulum sp. 2E275 TaxID=2980497 RepID=UPI0021D1ECEC|nr:conjugal transfer protein TraF [Catenovulum sp. 2E275]MCU4674495.1 conjugal transfer protein TraF [Catenovulum sp. 2E275]